MRTRRRRKRRRQTPRVESVGKGDGNEEAKCGRGKEIEGRECRTYVYKESVR